MFDISAFFRRNRRVFWFAVAAFISTFISIQLGKVFATIDTNYGEIASCSYTHQAPELQTPIVRENRSESTCAKRG
jgi:hypothetical protein